MVDHRTIADIMHLPMLVREVRHSCVCPRCYLPLTSIGQQEMLTNDFLRPSQHGSTDDPLTCIQSAQTYHATCAAHSENDCNRQHGRLTIVYRENAKHFLISHEMPKVLNLGMLLNVIQILLPDHIFDWSKWKLQCIHLKALAAIACTFPETVPRWPLLLSCLST